MYNARMLPRKRYNNNENDILPIFTFVIMLLELLYDDEKYADAKKYLLRIISCYWSLYVGHKSLNVYVVCFKIKFITHEI